ncbi:MAG: hypothetical protein EOO78_31615, partial [Oxalobacteraceae bacterium]
AGGVLLAGGTGKPFRYNRRDTLLNGDFIALGDPNLPWRRLRSALLTPASCATADWDRPAR